MVVKVLNPLELELHTVAMWVLGIKLGPTLVLVLSSEYTSSDTGDPVSSENFGAVPEERGRWPSRWKEHQVRL